MYSTVKELHIGIDLGLQRINTGTKQVIKPQEKDWVLNEVMYQLVNQVSDPSSKISRNYFEIDQKAIDMLETLKINDNPRLPIFLNKTQDAEAYTWLPTSYLRMSKLRALIGKADIIASNDASRTPNNINVYKVLFPDANALADYTSTFKISLAAHDIFDMAVKNSDDSAIYNYDNFNNNETKYIVIKRALDVLNSIKGVRAYWTKYGNIVQANSFIIFTDVNEIDSDIYDGVLDTSHIILTIGTKSEDVTPIVHTTYLPIINNDCVIKPCRIISSDKEDDINTHYYARSAFDSPTVTFGNNSLKVNIPTGYTIRALIPEYYRKPLAIDYYANQNCEVLSSDFQNDLVAKTVQKIAARIEDKNYPNIINENLFLE